VSLVANSKEHLTVHNTKREGLLLLKNTITSHEKLVIANGSSIANDNTCHS